jgi:histidinol-phosphate aminotransferase
VAQVPYEVSQIKSKVLLHANESPYGINDSNSTEALQSISELVSGLNRYPDRYFLSLRNALASYLERDTGNLLKGENIWAGNGSNEILQNILMAFGGEGRTLLLFCPDYPMYPVYARNTKTECISLNRNKEFMIESDSLLTDVKRINPDIIFLASPNNPSGTPMDIDTIKSILGMSTAMVVVDEAYGEFRDPAVDSAISLLQYNPRLIVTRTLSKAFSMAGCRLGYMAAHRSVIDAMKLVTLPYHLSSITQAMATYAVNNATSFLAHVQKIRDERDFLRNWLMQRGISVPESHANFLMFGKFEDADLLWENLLNSGVLIRKTALEGWLRVSIGTETEMRTFRDKIKPFL